MYEVTRIHIYSFPIKKKLTFIMNVLKISWIVELFTQTFRDLLAWARAQLAQAVVPTMTDGHS